MHVQGYRPGCAAGSRQQTTQGRRRCRRCCRRLHRTRAAAPRQLGVPDPPYRAPECQDRRAEHCGGGGESAPAYGMASTPPPHLALLWRKSQVRCRDSQAVRRPSRKRLRESVQGFESLSRRQSFRRSRREAACRMHVIQALKPESWRAASPPCASCSGPCPHAIPSGRDVFRAFGQSRHRII